MADPSAIVSTKPAIDCTVTWDTKWTPCSSAGTQARRYTVDVYPTRAGKQCPVPEMRSCSYDGPKTIMVDGKDGNWGTKDCANGQQRRKTLGYTGESHETFTMSSLCQYAPIKVTVGDVLVFKMSSASDTVFALPSQWHYAECNFTDAPLAGDLLPADASSTASEFRYTVRASDKNKRLYLASSRALACAAGQRVLVSVDDFKQGTLAEALELVKQTSYQTTEGAQSLIERIWCFEDHCPTPALGFYEGNLEWATARCKADAYSLLGFVYRKMPQPQISRAEAYYTKALDLVPTHCEATEYMGELYLQVNDFDKASATFSRLQALTQSENTAACKASLELLQNEWAKKEWCPPPFNTRSSCVQTSSAGSSVCHRLHALWLGSSLALMGLFVSLHVY